MSRARLSGSSWSRSKPPFQRSSISISPETSINICRPRLWACPPRTAPRVPETVNARTTQNPWSLKSIGQSRPRSSSKLMVASRFTLLSQNHSSANARHLLPRCIAVRETKSIRVVVEVGRLPRAAVCVTLVGSSTKHLRCHCGNCRLKAVLDGEAAVMRPTICAISRRGDPATGRQRRSGSPRSRCHDVRPEPVEDPQEQASESSIPAR